MRISTLFLCILLSLASYGQEKKKLDHNAYDSWNSVRNVLQSKTGAVISYEINPFVGDGKLFIEGNKGDFKKSFNRGTNTQISSDESFIVFTISPEADTIRELKLAEVKRSKFPKDTLAVYFPSSDSLFTVPNIKSYQLAEEGAWIAYLSQEDERTPCPTKKKKCKRHKKKNCELSKTSGTTLHLINPITGAEKAIDRVVSYQMSKSGNQLAYTTSNKGEEDTLDIHIISLSDMSEYTLLKNQLKISKLSFDALDKQFIFMHTADTNKRKNYALSYWKKGMENATQIIDSTTTGMPTDWTISGFCFPYFSENGKRIFIGTNLIVKQEPKDTLLKEEKAVVDVWSGFDLRVQPEQLSDLALDKRKNYEAVYHIADKRLVQVEDEIIDRSRVMDQGNSDYALGYSNKTYQKSRSWEYPWKNDLYLINLKNGERDLIKVGQDFTSSLSPNSEYLIWYEGLDSAWFARPVGSKDSTNLTTNFNALFASDVNGNTYTANPEGSSGWTMIKGREFFIVNSRYDVWALCPSDPTLSFCVTNQDGKRDEEILRLNRFDFDSTYTNIESGLIYGINFKTKREAYYSIIIGNIHSKITPLIASDHKYLFISKADESDQVLFRKSSFTYYPELELTNLNFDEPRQLTEANPQQKEYNWGTVEIVDWTSFEGRELRGLLYKPEDFDPNKSYPMITYFYEDNTQNLHFYYSPRPTASIVFPTEYVSNGYLIFIPDIEYTPGHPGKSAYDCIVSGTDHLAQTYSWVDSTRIGLQGQSWGGYQTAQLITMTTRYKAAMAGAPVSNMFSAYGGVRWTSGLSRMFQYEHGQSRIGATIWEKPELYIENSPIFGLNKVNTPLLIMHNDGDGSVPWYQGIELYMGLRRLNQPVWLLNYNGDEHNLMETANRRDLSIRMRQFFDYYLLDAEIPEWMDEGVPATDKGINYKLELKKN